MGNSGSGSKNRHASGEDTAPTLTATSRYTEGDIYEQGAPFRVSISHLFKTAVAISFKKMCVNIVQTLFRSTVIFFKRYPDAQTKHVQKSIYE